MTDDFLLGLVIGAMLGVALWDLYLMWIYRGGRHDD